jgi:chaperonin GroES
MSVYLDNLRTDDYQSLIILRKKGVVYMRVRPLRDRIIVKQLGEEEKSKGGIIIPDSAKEKPMEGKVVAVGKGKVKKDGTKAPMELKVGDRVLFARYGGTEVKIDGEEHLMMKEDDVLAVIEK